MAGCTDWMKTLRRASFRGASYWLSSDDIEVGRRLEVHQFPNRDRPFVEDLGEQAIKFSQHAYLASDNLAKESAALVSACRRRGPGTLVIPLEGSQRVRCISCRRTHALDKLGFVAFTLDFVEAGVGMNATPIPLLSRLTEFAATAAVSAITQQFVATFNTVRAEFWIVDAAVSRFQSFLEAFDTVRRETRTGRVSSLEQSTARAYRDATDLMIDGADANELTQTRIGLASRSANGGTVVTTISELVTELRESALDDFTAYEALSRLAEWGVADSGLPAYGTAGIQDARNEDAFGSMVRQIVLTNLAVAAARADWTTREQAIAVRSTTSELFERELHAAGGGSDLFVKLSDVRSRAAEALSQRIIDQDPIATIEATAILPSLVWAYRLSEDANDAIEIMELNKLAHPGFVPLVFRARIPLEPEDHVSDRRRRQLRGGGPG